MKIQKNLSINDCQIKMDDNGGFAGYASVFGGVDSYGDTIVKGAYEKTLADHGLPKMFFNHNDLDIPIGKWIDAGEDDTGLMVKGELTDGNTKANDVHLALKHGTVDGLSVGFYTSSDDYEVTDDGRTFNEISKLVEVSVVTYPADSNARIDLTTVKSELDRFETIKDFERFLRDSGMFSKAGATAFCSRFVQLIKQGDPVEKDEQEIKAALEMLNNFNFPKL